MKNFVTLLALSLSFAGGAWAADAGTAGANFLKIGVGPRAVGMGEAQVGLADDAYATYWNPAGLAQIETPQAAFTHTQYFQKITDQYAAYVHPLRRLGVVAASVNFLNVGNFDAYDGAGQPAGTVDASDLAAGVSFARALLESKRYHSLLAVGGTAKVIRENLASVSAQAYAVDGGLFWAPGRRFGEFWESWRGGLTVRNLGTRMRFDEESFSLPQSVTAGLAWTGVWLGESLTIAADAHQPKDGERWFGAGFELWTLRTLVVRAGYTSRGDLGNGLRVGGGIRFRNVQADYAFTSAGDMGMVHRMGLTFHFGRAPATPEFVAQQWFDKGMKKFDAGRWAEALVDFNKALQIDPSHPKAFEMMQQTYEKLKAERGPHAS
jgi:hypothetical protein